MQSEQHEDFNKGFHPNRYLVGRNPEVRKAKSALTLAEAEQSPEKEAGQQPPLDMGRRFLRWIKRVPLKRNMPFGVTVKPSSVEPTQLLPDKPRDDHKGFTGNLGLGQYIGSEDRSYINHEASEEYLRPGGSQFISKSFIDLSSLSLFPHALSEGDAKSRQGSSLLDTEEAKDDVRDYLHPCIPPLLRAVLLGSAAIDLQGDDTGRFMTGYSVTGGGVQDGAEQNVNFPAWLLTNGNQLMLDTPYVVYKTRDCLAELSGSVRWLTDRLQQSRAGRTASSLSSSHLLPSQVGTTNVKHNSLPESGVVAQSCERCSWLTNQNTSSIETILEKLIENHRQLQHLFAGSTTSDNPNHATIGSPAPQSAYLILETSAEARPIQIAPFLAPNQDPSINNPSKIGYRKVLGEESVLVYKVPNHGTRLNRQPAEEERPLNCSMLLTSDSLWLSGRPLPKSVEIVTTQVTFDSCFPLVYLWCQSVSSQQLAHNRQHLDKDALSVLLASTDPWESQNVVSSSSGVSNASLDDDQDESGHRTSEVQLRAHTHTLTELANQITTSANGLEMKTLLLIGCPIAENLILRFRTSTLCKEWKALLDRTISSCQSIFQDRLVNVKLMNKVADNQIIYKSYSLELSNTASELKERGLASMDIKTDQDVEILAVHDVGTYDSEIPLRCNEKPFLIAFCIVHGLCDWLSQLVKLPSVNKSHPASLPRDRQLIDAVFTQHTGEAIVSGIPKKDSLISGNQIKVRFILRPCERLAPTFSEKIRRRSSHHRRQDGSKQPQWMSRPQRNKRKVAALAKSSIYLNSTATDDGGVPATPLRAAISMDALGPIAAQRQWEIFGKLPQDVWPDAQLSRSLMSLFVVVYYTADRTEFVFRKTAAASQIEKLRSKVDANLQPITLQDCSPLLAACVLKKYFSEIPGHLLNDENWSQWCAVLDFPTQTEREEAIIDQVRQLPKVCQTLLALLLYTLARVRDNEATNRMSAQSLAIVWGPSLLQRPDQSLILEASRISNQLVECLLQPSLTTKLTWSPELPRQFDALWRSVNTDPKVYTALSMPSPSVQVVTSVSDKSDDVPSLGSSLDDRSDASSTEDRQHNPRATSISSVHLENHSESPLLHSIEINDNSPVPSRSIRDSSRTHGNLSISSFRNRMLRPVSALYDSSPQSSLEAVYDERFSPNKHPSRLSSRSQKLFISELEVDLESTPAGDSQRSSRLMLQMPGARQTLYSTAPPPIPPKGTLLTSRGSQFNSEKESLRARSVYPVASVSQSPKPSSYQTEVKWPVLPTRKQATDSTWDSTRFRLEPGRLPCKSQFIWNPSGSDPRQTRDPPVLNRGRRFQSVDNVNRQSSRQVDLPNCEYPLKYSKRLGTHQVETRLTHAIQMDDSRRRNRNSTAAARTARLADQSGEGLADKRQTRTVAAGSRRSITDGFGGTPRPPPDIHVQPPVVIVEMPNVRRYQSLDRLEIPVNVRRSHGVQAAPIVPSLLGSRYTEQALLPE